MTEPDFDFDRYDRVRPIRWTGDALELLDQRRLPFEVGYVRCETYEAVAEAIANLTVRGAPAIGIAAAWGAVLASRTVDAPEGRSALDRLEPAFNRLNPSGTREDARAVQTVQAQVGIRF